jgi:lipopolysaccharide biosynthesis protein
MDRDCGMIGANRGTDGSPSDANALRQALSDVLSRPWLALGDLAMFWFLLLAQRLPILPRKVRLRFARSARKRDPARYLESVVAEPLAPEADAPVALREGPPPAAVTARLIAFYLPQFHPIPENDAWWGRGFTEWTNVTRARPQFEGHRQPRLPGELGFYDLRLREPMRRQIELARLYGVGGFCFYFYWFGGRTLLETPLRTWLDDPSLDLPFCLCWANENWTRRWDGRDREVLIAQNHSHQDDLAFIAHIAPYLRDPRAIRLNGRPLLLVYRPDLLEDARATAARWRDWCAEAGVGPITLGYVQTVALEDPAIYGFDVAVEFPPNMTDVPDIDPSRLKFRPGFVGRVKDWQAMAASAVKRALPSYTLLRGVNPGWDNTPRRDGRATIHYGATPDAYRTWLEAMVAQTAERFPDPADRLIFVNAWNEGAEGAVLEPDAGHGYAWLQATVEGLTSTQLRA